MVKADKARAVEDLLIRMAQGGQVRAKITEKQLIELLEQVNQQTKSETKIVVSVYTCDSFSCFRMDGRNTLLWRCRVLTLTTLLFCFCFWPQSTTAEDTMTRMMMTMVCKCLASRETHRQRRWTGTINKHQFYNIYSLFQSILHRSPLRTNAASCSGLFCLLFRDDCC